jgi:hypothetical protein
MKGLCEGDEPERSEAGRQRLGAQLDEALVRRGGRPRGTRHLCVRVDPDRLLDERRKQVRQGARAAADVEQATSAVELQRYANRVRELARIGEPAPRVVGGAARVERRIPFPSRHARRCNQVALQPG